MARAPEDAAISSAQGKDVTGADEVIGAGAVFDGGQDGGGSILRRDARLDSLFGLDRNRQSDVNSLMPVVYQELYKLAKRFLEQERPGHTLQATALVHETYLKLTKQRKITWEDRAHFVALAARVMRQVLVQHARQHKAAKRNPKTGQVAGDVPQSSAAASDDKCVDLLTLDELLIQLSELDVRQSSIVELRFFAGLTVIETAKVLKVSRATVEREWAMARAWLHNQLKSSYLGLTRVTKVPRTKADEGS